jgi:hypothetical protein
MIRAFCIIFIAGRRLIRRLARLCSSARSFEGHALVVLLVGGQSVVEEEKGLLVYTVRRSIFLSDNLKFGALVVRYPWIPLVKRGLGMPRCGVLTKIT